MSTFKKCPIGTEIQTLIFHKQEYPLSYSVKKWVQRNGFEFKKVDEKTDTWRVRQKDPDSFKKDSFRTIDLANGIQAVIGCPMEKKRGW